MGKFAKYIWGLCSIAVIGLCGCALQTEQKRAASEIWRISAVLPQEPEFWEQMMDGVRDGAKEENAALSEYLSTQKYGILSRFQIAEEANVDGMILFSSDNTDSALLQEIKTARENGKKIVMVDSDIGEDYYDEFVGIDNAADARKLAAWLTEQMREQDRFLVIHVEASEAVAQREQAFCEYMEQNDMDGRMVKVSLEGKQDANILQLQKELERDGMIRWIVSFTPTETLQAAEMLSRQKTDQVSVAGFGESEQSRAYLESGEIAALLVQDNYEIGRYAVKDMIKLLDGEQQNDKYRYVKSELITKERKER